MVLLNKSASNSAERPHLTKRSVVEGGPFAGEGKRMAEVVALFVE